VDEGDHFAGGPPTNPGRDGVTTPCQYTPGSAGPNTVGEQDVEINDLLAKETGDTTKFNMGFDDAPSFQVDATSPTAGIPGPYDPSVRGLERHVGSLTVANQRTGATDLVTQHIADQADLAVLHMINADPLRTPSFVRQTGSVWTDHTDVRSTMLETLGLADDYMSDGNAVTEVLDPRSLPLALPSLPPEM
jgi:hypothetical protein